MHSSLNAIAHRPWPLPSKPWAWRQSWLDLLFAHWPVPLKALRPHIPSELEIEEFDGTGWLGVVPFRMAGVAKRPLPDIPGTSAFPELNVRTYVNCGGRPGVWFFSLDASNALAVWAAKTFFHLPYFRSRMSLTDDNRTIKYSSVRKDHTGGPAFAAEYSPVSDPFLAEPGTLEHWLTERYCLYARTTRGKIQRTEVHHRQWPLQKAKAQITENEMGRSFGVSLEDEPATLHFSRSIDVIVWNPETVDCGARPDA